MRRALFVSLFCFLLPLVAQAAEDGDIIELRQLDEVYFRDGSVEKGVLIETDNPEKMKIRNSRTQVVREFLRSDVKEFRYSAKPDSQLQRLAKENAGKPDMIVRLAKEALRRFNNQRPRVIEMLERESSGRNADVLGLLCDLYLQAGQYKEALKSAEALVAAAPASARSYMWRGLAFANLDFIEGAGKDLEKAWKQAPDDQDVCVARADFLLRSGRSDEAREMFSTALSKNGKNVAALVGQGRVLLRQGEFKDAEASFRDAIALDGKHIQAQLGLTAVKIMNTFYDEAYKDAEHILNIDPKSSEAYSLQAFSKLLTGDQESLQGFYTELKASMALKANQPRLLMAWAVALEREAKFNEALGTKEALATAQKNRDEANSKFAELYAADPADAYLQYFIGEKKFRGNDLPGAEAAFTRTTKLAPSYAPAQAALGAVLLRGGKWDAAQEAYSAAIKLDANGAEYHAGKGVALLKIKRFEEASIALANARRLDKRNITALCGLAYVANVERNKASSIDLFQQALAADGNCAYAADALRRIYSQEGMSLEYVTFAELNPPGWKSRGGGSIKPVPLSGQMIFTGTQGSATGGKTEYIKEIKAEEFVRLEADLDMSPTSAVTFGLRLASAVNSTTSFEIEIGKDETNEIKMRYRDYRGAAPAWQSLKVDWPKSGRVRLGIETDDLKEGKIRLIIDGKRSEPFALELQKPTRIVAGVFVQAPPKETVRGAVDNIVLVLRGAHAQEDRGDAQVIFKAEDEKPAVPVPAPENKEKNP